MSFLMVYAMICYNIALNMGGMSNQVFLLAFRELIIMWPVAFILEYFFVDKMAHHLAFKVVTPKDRPFFITLAISFNTNLIIDEEKKEAIIFASSEIVFQKSNEHMVHSNKFAKRKPLEN